jgi:MFS family permease
MATEVPVQTANARAGFYGWALLGAFWLIMFLNLGFPVYGQAVVSAAMAKTLGFDRHTLGIIFSVFIGMSGVPGPIVAMSVNKLGVRGTLIIGSLLVIAGAALMAGWVHEPWQAVIALGVIIGAGVVTGSALATQAGVARWFVRRRALALSILYSAGAIGGFVAAWLLSKIIDYAGGDWRAGWWFMAALSVVALLIAAFAVKENPADLGQLPDGGMVGETAGAAAAHALRTASFISKERWTYGEAIRTPAYWMIVLAFVGGSGGLSLILSQGVSYLMDLGHPRPIAARAISILSISGLIAKVFVATLGDRMDPRYMWAVFVAVFGLGLVLVVDARSYGTLVGFSICIGIGFGGGIVCLMAVLSNYYGASVFASLSGLAVAINTGCSVVAPIVGGWLYDKGYGYRGTFYTLAVWCFVGALVLFVMRVPHKTPRVSRQ